MKPNPNEPKAFKWLVGIAIALVGAIVLGIVAVMVTSILGGRSDAGRPCPEKVSRYVRRFAGATVTPQVEWSGCKGSGGLVLRSSFTLDDTGTTILEAALDSRGFQRTTFGDLGTVWVRAAREQRTTVFASPAPSSGRYSIVHAEEGTF